MKGFKNTVVMGVVFACVVLLLVTVHRYQGQLQSSDEALRRYGTEVTDLQEENSRLSNRIASATDWKLQSDKDLVELRRLRAEVAQLRKQKKELEAAKAKPAAQTNDVPLQAVAAAPQAAEVREIPKDAWAFAGYQTPATAFESLAWAMKNGDLNTFLASLSPQAQTAAAVEFQGMSDAEIAAKLQNEIDGLDALPLDRVKSMTDSAVTFVIFSADTDNGTVKTRDEAVVTFTNVGGLWKATGF